MGQYGLSQAVTRREDLRLLTGRGQYTDDHQLAGTLVAAFLRSPHGHARINALDISAARELPGVVAIYTAAELSAAQLRPIPCRNPPAMMPSTTFHEHPQPLLVSDQVRYVGDAVAMVVAENAAIAQDALEAIAVDYDALPATVDAFTATQDHVVIWEDLTDNVAFRWETGERDNVSAIFSQASQRIRLQVHNPRIVQNALETRGALAYPDGDQLTLITGTQMPNGVCNQLSAALGLQPGELRVKVNDVGGSFGGKNSPYPEQVLVVHAARELQRPVKWLASRSEAFLTDFQGRDNHNIGELAVDAHGNIQALRVLTYANLGAYTSAGSTIAPINGVVMSTGCYRIPHLYVEVRGVYTNTVPTDPYRGAGRPEVTFLLERLMDVAAKELGEDRVAFRRRHLIPPQDFPYTTPSGLTYDHCEFERLLDDALLQADWAGFPQRQQAALNRGKQRGIGLCQFIERCGGGGGLAESARLVFAADGSLSLYSGAMSNGQGHETAYSQILAERFDLPFDKIHIIQGDTSLIPAGMGTGGSWSLPMGGGAVWTTSDTLLEQLKAVAAESLEVAVTDVEFRAGQFQVAGTDLGTDLATVVSKAAAQNPTLLRASATFTPTNYTFPYGCHICEVEVDPDTGQVEIISYTSVHDFGRALNPLLLAGQVHGGVVQGFGQALLEHTVYDDHGQLLSGSYVDYCLPRADDIPAMAFHHRETTPSLHNPMNIKGCGEAGAAGSPPAVINALCDALGLRHLEMPATPERVWQAIQGCPEH